MFSESCPSISSTKSLSGHSLELQASMNDFLINYARKWIFSASANIENIDPEAENLTILLERKEETK